MTSRSTLSEGISLRKLLPEAQFFGAQDIRVRSYSADSQRCLTGDLFAAIAGPDVDGHDFIMDALERGASSILSERQLPINQPTCVVPNSRQAYGKICHALADHPSQELKVIGVTGTNGKTTVCALIKAVLEEAGAKVGSASSFGYDNGYDQQRWNCTIPGAAIQADLLSRMRFNGCSHALLEVSSQALALDDLAGIEFDAVAITNIRQNHTNFHGSVRNYFKAKQKVLSYLRDTGFAVFNADDPTSNRLMEGFSLPSLSVALHGVGEITASVVERHKSEQTFLIFAGGESAVVCTRMIGDQHIYNCLIATAVGLVYGISLQTIVRGLESIQSLPSRMERIECGQPFGVFVDQATTHDGLAMALKAIRRVTHGRVICVYGADHGGDSDRRPMLGRVIEKGADVALLTSSGQAHASSLEIVHDLLDGFAKPAKAHIIPTREEAIRWAISQAETGDTILLAGQKDRFADAEFGETEDHCDREIAQRLLYEMAPQIGSNDYSAPAVSFPKLL